MSIDTVDAALRAMGYIQEQITGHSSRATARTITDEVLGATKVIDETAKK